MGTAGGRRAGRGRREERSSGSSRLRVVGSAAALGVMGIAGIPVVASAWPGEQAPVVVAATSDSTSGTSSGTSATASASSTGAASSTDGASTAAPSSTAAPAQSTAMPVGDLPGWHQVFSDDFTTDVPLGQFPGTAYKGRWMSYDGFKDTWEVGVYDPSRVLSVQGGALDYWLHTEDGVPRVAAPVPLLDGAWGGQLYGKVTVRFRADAAAGYSPSFLAWPDSDRWSQGEIDFAEGDLSKTISQYNHCLGDDAAVNCATAEALGGWDEWHTAGFEWTPQGVTLLFDGRPTAVSDTVPSDPMHLVLQVQSLPGVSAQSQGHLQVDWVSVYGYDASTAS